MNITEIPSVEVADLLFLNKVQIYYRSWLKIYDPNNWVPLTLWNGRCTKPSEFHTFTFGVETE